MSGQLDHKCISEYSDSYPLSLSEEGLEEDCIRLHRRFVDSQIIDIVVVYGDVYITDVRRSLKRQRRADAARGLLVDIPRFMVRIQHAVPLREHGIKCCPVLHG